MFRKILSIATLIIVAIVVFCARDQIFQAVDYLANTNIWFILALIPEQLFMYYCVGQMFFSYMSARHQVQKVSPWTLARISFELNFVNTAIPSGSIAGLGYITWRLKPFGASVGDSSFMYALRYIITICANQFQTLVAILILLLTGAITAGSAWVVILATIICVALFGVFTIIIIVASRTKRIEWASQAFTNLANRFLAFFTGKKHRKVVKYEVVKQYLTDIHSNLLVARRNKKILLKPIIWGIVYSFLEVATFWLVGISMGHPEILPQIMVAEAISSVVGAFMLTPGGIGGYEGAMIFFMSVLGVDVGLATAVVITTRVVILIGTIASGYGFYQNAISKIGKKDRAEIKNINKQFKK